MKNYSFLLLILLTSCQVVDGLKNRVLNLVGMAPEAEPVAETTYTPEPPPSLEKDAVVQISPKEKILTLFEQFNRSPDDYLAGLLISEITQNKSLFGASKDAALSNVLNRLVPLVQQGHAQTLNLLVQLMPLFLGENKELVRAVLSRGFDSAPLLLAELLIKRAEDKLCYMAGIIPNEITLDEKRNFLATRRDQLTMVKETSGLSASVMSYVETCIKTLELALAPMEPAPATEQEEPAPTAEPTPAPTPAPEPTPPPVSEPQPANP